LAHPSEFLTSDLPTGYHAGRSENLKANAHCERFIGSLKRECLDHVLILHRQQLHRLVAEFIDYYNRSQPHQGIGQRIPTRFDQNYRPQSGKVVSTHVLGGLHHSYTQTANLN
jgi:putative transposase